MTGNSGVDKLRNIKGLI